MLLKSCYGEFNTKVEVNRSYFRILHGDLRLVLFAALTFIFVTKSDLMLLVLLFYVQTDFCFPFVNIQVLTLTSLNKLITFSAYFFLNRSVVCLT